jgi:hypothetical protein
MDFAVTKQPKATAEQYLTIPDIKHLGLLKKPFLFVCSASLHFVIYSIKLST